MAARKRRVARYSPGSGGGGGSSSGVITSGHVWAFLVVGFLFGCIILGGDGTMSEAAREAIGSSEWIVRSVSDGRIYLENVATGRVEGFADPELVRQALKGILKAGDHIKY